MSSRQVAVALFCFDDKRAAPRVRRLLEPKLRAGGDVVLQTTVVQVNARHRASVHDPRRVLAGTLTAFHLPAEGFAILLGVDAILDMARTSVNVLGNCLASVVVARWEGFKVGEVSLRP